MKTRVLNFRLDQETEALLDAWLAKNPGFSITQVANLALRSFVTQPFVLEAVSLEKISDEKYYKALEQNISEHADALERLK